MILNELIKKVSLHNHSEYSNIRLLDSINKIEDMIKYTASIGDKGVALTDHDSLSGHVKFIQAIQNLKESGDIPQDFKGILGNEIYLISEDKYRQAVEHKQKIQYYHFLLLAKDEIGHRQLRELSTLAWKRSYTAGGMDRVPTFYSDFSKVIKDEPGHLIGGTACLGGFVPQHILPLIFNSDVLTEEDSLLLKQEVDTFIRWGIETFGRDNFFLEIQPSDTEEQVEFNHFAIKLAGIYNVKYVITTDAHYLTKADRKVHKAYLTSNKKGDKNREVDSFYETTYFFTTEEIYEMMGKYLTDDEISTGLSNSYLISQEIKEYSLAHEQIIPQTPIPKESEWNINTDLVEAVLNSTKYIYLQQGLNGSVVDKYTVNLALSLLPDTPGITEDDIENSLQRLNLEYKEILGASEAKKVNLAQYFITMKKNIDLIWESGSIVGVSRGSAGAYILDLILGITQLNPLQQGVLMPHWRFISAERPDYPDIDIDIPSYKRDEVFEYVRDYYLNIGGDMIRVATFGTETSKSAIITAVRGLGYDSDMGLYLSSLIPVERGTVRDLRTVYYGDDTKDIQPIYEFKQMVDKHDGLLEVALGIEGLVNKRSIHSCGVIIFNNDAHKYNAVMKAPNGELITQYSLEDSEYLGGMKYDFLNTRTESMIQITLELLLENGLMEWKGSLRDTYNHYLHPANLNTNNQKYWELLNNKHLLSAFQFDSLVGEQAIDAIKPQNLLEATDANNLMRLMVDDGIEKPMSRYIRYKDDINNWYRDMRTFGLTDQEIKLVKKYLLKNYGVCSTQEDMMLLTMDENIANFDVVEANVLRKGVAKKVGDKYEKAHQLFYTKGRELGASEKLLDYIWDVQIAMQKGYGFSLIHSIGYTYILIQQLELITSYNPMFWNTAVLTVNAEAVEGSQGSNKSTNYGKIAIAIEDIRKHKIDVVLPNINTASYGFKPELSDDSIMFGFKGLNGLGDSSVEAVLQNRPFQSFDDFIERMYYGEERLLSKTAIINLIKAGAFNYIEQTSRKDLMKYFFKTIYTQENQRESTLTFANLSKVAELSMIPPNLLPLAQLYSFGKHICKQKFFLEKRSNRKWNQLPENDRVISFFEDMLVTDLVENVDYVYNDATVEFQTSKVEKLINKRIEPLEKWLKAEDTAKEYTEKIVQLYIDEDWDKYCEGSYPKWEMDSLSFYYSGHEFDNVNHEKYGIVNFYSLPEEPNVFKTVQYKDFTYKQYNLSCIAGTVLHKDKGKHVVYLSTLYGVVKVKMAQGLFGYYDRQISVHLNGENKKTIVDKSWFTRGNKVMFVGYRRGGQFRAKNYQNSAYQHTAMLINDVESNGDLLITTERYSDEE